MTATSLNEWKSELFIMLNFFPQCNVIRQNLHAKNNPF